MKRPAPGNRHVLITGASEGIGRAVALEYARRGVRLTLCARNRAKLEDTAAIARGLGGVVHARATDVTDEHECRRLIAEAGDAHGDIDLLVANAGIGSAAIGEADASPATLRRYLETNVIGVANVVDPALPGLIRRRGAIVAISSLQGLIPFPKAAAYAASKFAMRGFLESLRLDLSGRVDVVMIYPGPVATGIFAKDALADKQVDGEKLARQAMSVERCALAICDAMESRRRQLIMTRSGRLAFVLSAVFPRLVGRLTRRGSERFYR